jgi:FkbM family methyltransferase
MYLKVAKILRKVSRLLVKISNSLTDRYVSRLESKALKNNLNESLFTTKDNIRLWLGNVSVIDQNIKRSGVWEPITTELVKKLIKKNDVVIDVGANIGYYTTLFAKSTGNEGFVYAFEPTTIFHNLLVENISLNHFSNVTIIKKGLSNKKGNIEILIDNSSASIHQPQKGDVINKEIIELTTLDDYVEEFGLEKINFIKIDIDGHEPFVLEGAIRSIFKFKPIVILEISHLHYFEAGINAWDFYEKLKEWGFLIYLENEVSEIKSKTEFLMKCGDFSHSVNIILSLNKLKIE